ncbi:MAG: 50S ribosomal protein L11 methyltransferase, partial [Thermomicrobiaceae bacterium]|nr:50S ribosomal protein L11 methyltransferase [Thermomicrobiaceae bacterium]
MRADEVAGQARADRLARLVEEARRVGPLREVDLVLPESGCVDRLLQPADMDALLDAVQHDPEQNLPYWAELWPSGIALADLLEREPGLVAGARALEVGCGLGVTAIAALRAGADLLAADYAPEALVLCRANALANAGREPATLQFNWRRPGPDLLDVAGAG